MPRQPDPKRPDDRVVVRDFPGIDTSADPHDIEAGAATRQTNLVATRPGELRLRGGLRIVRFED